MELEDMMTISQEEIKAADNEAMRLIKEYGEVIKNENSSKQEIIEAANKTIKALGKYADLQIKSKNELITAGQVLSEALNKGDKANKSKCLN